MLGIVSVTYAHAEGETMKFVEELKMTCGVAAILGVYPPPASRADPAFARRSSICGSYDAH